MGMFSRNPKIPALETEVEKARNNQKGFEHDQKSFGYDQSEDIGLQQKRIDRALDALHTQYEIEKYRAQD